MNLRSRGGPGHGLTIDEYIVVYCYPDTTNAGQYSRLSITPSGLSATDVLCGGVHDTDHL